MTPVEKEEPLSLEAFGKLALSGAVCASAAHFALTPLELTKARPDIYIPANPTDTGCCVFQSVFNQSHITHEYYLACEQTRLQLVSQSKASAARKSNPGPSKTTGKGSTAAVEEASLSPIETLVSIFREEGGLGGLFQGADSSAAGYFVAGGLGFAMTELFRRLLVAGAGGRGGLEALGLDLSAATIGAALAAGVIATIAVAPFEKARVQLQNQASSGANGVAGALADLAADDRGWVVGLFDGVPLLLAKDIVFAVVKFQSFDVAKSALFSFDPHLREGLGGSLLVSLAAGAAAGIFSALASQPGDTVFTKLASRGRLETASPLGAQGSAETYGPLDALREVLETQGPSGLYAGAGARAIFAGVLLALEFLIYDYLREIFHVTSGDLVVTLDVLGTLQQ